MLKCKVEEEKNQLNSPTISLNLTELTSFSCVCFRQNKHGMIDEGSVHFNKKKELTSI